MDTYALGIVMYTLLNKNRAPFLPAYPQPIIPKDRETALQRRMSGEPIPELAEGTSSAQLSRLVLKACAADRKARYANPTEMRKALESLAASEGYEPESSPLPATNMGSTPAPKAHGQTLHLLSPETNPSLNRYINITDDTSSKHESSSSVHTGTAEPAFAAHPDSSPQADSPAQTKPSPQSTPASPTLKRLFIAAAIIVVLALGAFFVRLGINVQTTNYGIRINGQTDIILPTKTEAQAALDDLTAYYIQLVNADANTVSASYEEDVKIIKSKPANLSHQSDQPHEIQVMNRQEALDGFSFFGESDACRSKTVAGRVGIKVGKRRTLTAVMIPAILLVAKWLQLLRPICMFQTVNQFKMLCVMSNQNIYIANTICRNQNIRIIQRRSSFAQISMNSCGKIQHSPVNFTNHCFST